MGTDDQHERPLVDVSPALGEAGHEEELLGTADVPDTAPVLREDGEDVDDAESQILGDIATRGIDTVD